MNPETWVAIIAALISIVAAVLNWRSAHAAEREAHAAEEQTRIQRQLRIDAAQPYVWADIRPDDAVLPHLNLVVGNNGPTVAKKVRVKIDPPLPAVDANGRRAEIAAAILTEGIESLPPGRVLQWPLGPAGQLIDNNNGPQAYEFIVNANGPFGAVPALRYIVDMSNWRETLTRPSGSLHWLTVAVNKLTKTIGERSTSASDP